MFLTPFFFCPYKCCLLESRRKNELKNYPKLKKNWKHYEKQFALIFLALTFYLKKEKKKKTLFSPLLHISSFLMNRDPQKNAETELERNFLSNMLKNFVELLESISETDPISLDVVRYCDRFIELLTDLEAQLPTRRYFNTLFDDHNILLFCQFLPFLLYLL